MRSAARIYTSPLTIIVVRLRGVCSIMRSYSGNCRSISVCDNRCPRSQRKTGMGVNTLPLTAYDGNRLLCPPACRMMQRSPCSHFSACCNTHVVPPPDPNRWPIGSQVQKYSSRDKPVTSWKLSTTLGGNDNSFLIIFICLAVLAQSGYHAYERFSIRGKR